MSATNTGMREGRARSSDVELPERNWSPSGRGLWSSSFPSGGRERKTRRPEETLVATLVVQDESFFSLLSRSLVAPLVAATSATNKGVLVALSRPLLSVIGSPPSFWCDRPFAESLLDELVALEQMQPPVDGRVRLGPDVGRPSALACVRAFDHHPQELTADVVLRFFAVFGRLVGAREHDRQRDLAALHVEDIRAAGRLDPERQRGELQPSQLAMPVQADQPPIALRKRKVAVHFVQNGAGAVGDEIVIGGVLDRMRGDDDRGEALDLSGRPQAALRSRKTSSRRTPVGVRMKRRRSPSSGRSIRE